MKADVVKWVIVVVALAIAGGGSYYAYTITRSCAHSVAYTLASIDGRFGVSTSTVLAQARAASGIWNRAAGKTVLVYDENAELAIRFVYDEREATTKLGSEITRQQAALDTLRASLDEQQAELVANQAAYNEKVAEVNARGGARPSEARALEDERATLQSLAASVNNAVAAYNARVATLNAQVERYNQTAGHPFEEGNYVRDGAGERITIFQFADTTQLERGLAHEVGHALGLDHNHNPKAITYSKN